MKKVLALVLALALALSLVACGGAASSTAPAASTATSAPAAEAEATTDELGRKIVDGKVAEDFTDAAGIVHPAGLPADYPDQDITYICPFAAGGTYDVWFRVLADKVKQLESHWDHSFVVEYKEGASGDVGWMALYNSEPDGYTIGFAPTPYLITCIGWDKPYGIDGGFDMVDSLMLDPGVIGVGANDDRFNTLNDLIDYAVANPGAVSFGVTAITASEGLTLKLLSDATGAEFNIIPFDGEAEILTAVSGGHCDAFCLNVSDGATFERSGQVKYLATGDSERSAWYPDIPTYQECGYDVVQYNCRGIAIREGTDPVIIKYLSNCFEAAAAQEDVIAKAEEMQITALSMGTEKCNQLFHEQNEILLDLWEVNPWN